MEKPLPDIPTPAAGTQQPNSGVNLATLTVESREHLKRFLLQHLEDEDVLANREEWVSTFQAALSELGECITTSGWLPGLKRARLIKRRSHKANGSSHSSNSGSGLAKKSETKGKADGEHAADSVPNDAVHVSKGLNESRDDNLELLRVFVTRPSPPTPKPRIRHLLLTLTPFGAQEPEEVRRGGSAVGCKFTYGVFSIPPPDASEDDRENILLGLNEWDASLASEEALQIVGGTFSFRGPTSPAQYAALRKVFRMSLFVYLSVLLEQHVLLNSHVPLRFRKPSITPASQTSLGASIKRALSPSRVSGESKKDAMSGFWSFLSRKKDIILSRAADAAPSLVRRGSLDSPLSPSSPRLANSDEVNSPLRQRRISFMADLRPPFMIPHREALPEDPPFASTLSALQKYAGLHSTSPGITLPPPPVLVRLAEKEKRDVERRLSGDERTALGSLLGWTSKADKGIGMTGSFGFVRHQGLCTLYSEATPSISKASKDKPETPAETPTTQRTSSSSSVNFATIPKLAYCGSKKKWITYRYWAQDGKADECLGEAIMRMCVNADDPCQEPGCSFKRGEHELRWIHGGVRIVANVLFDPEEQSDECMNDGLEMWESCSVCGKESKREAMSDGTFLFSFAKYLELLIYSPALLHLVDPPCEHVTAPPRPWLKDDTPLPKMRTNIVRHFTFNKRQLFFHLSTVDEIFDIHVPRLQITRGKPPEQGDGDLQGASTPPGVSDDKRALRREILRWWQALSEYIDHLESDFVSDELRSYHKALPRLPSADDAYDFLDDDSQGGATPKAHALLLPPHPPNTPLTPLVITNNPILRPLPPPVIHEEPQDEADTTSFSASTTSLSSTGSSDSLQLLSSLRHSFQRVEQNLYTELSRASQSCLNDVRRSFQTAAKGATRRLAAWQRKHTPTSSSDVNLPPEAQPEWWGAECHAVPGGNIIVRENDWGSIIAFTLSSQDFHRELANMSLTRPPLTPLPPPPTPLSARPSFFSKGKWFPPTAPQPDPDQDDAVWQEPEAYSAVISRKEHPRDPTSLLSLAIPEVLRKGPVDLASIPTTSKFAGLGPSMGKAGAVIPPSARAKPDVQLSMQAADALLSGVSTEGVDKLISGLEAVTDHPRSMSDSHATTSSASTFFETNIRRGKASSIISADSDATTIGPPSPDSDSSLPPPLPPKIVDPAPPVPEIDNFPPPDPESSIKESSITSSLTNTLTAAFRYMVNVGDPQPIPPKHHHGLLSAASPAIDDRPHIKYDWTIGKRLKFSCTVYYAKQFDSLRRRCGIEDTFLQSLSRCENWLAEGGKSKSNFWRTSDNQFIIKSLVNAWNVADLHVLLELGPSYFRYMDATASKATVLAKLLGFYTIEVRNLESNHVQAKADLLVMENLFYKHNIVKTFDLKGISGRKVKASSRENGSKTLFDGEWVEGQQRALTLVYPHSKVVLTEAIKSDCEFLARSNIMDYSLLLGICEERKVISCGLVDAIGSYTFAKTLEYKAKQGLNSGKEITVVPPAEYQERFVNAMDGYFLACPDKWSRPLDGTYVPCDYRKLPSVL